MPLEFWLSEQKGELEVSDGPGRRIDLPLPINAGIKKEPGGFGKEKGRNGLQE